MNEFLTYGLKVAVTSLAPFVYMRVKKRYDLRRIKEDIKFEFIESFLKEEIRQKHHLVVEQAFLKFSGRRLKYDEIVFLVGLQNPMSALNSYFWAQHYVAYDPENKTVSFKPKYKNSKKLKRLKFVHYFLYLLSAMAGTAVLLFFYELWRLGGFFMLPVLVALILLCLGIAYLQLLDGTSIYFAEKLIEEVEESKG